MSNVIQLESMSCPKCGVAVAGWYAKAEVVEGELAIRCPHCRTTIRFVVKGGVSEDDMLGAINKTLEQTINKEGE